MEKGDEKRMRYWQEVKNLQDKRGQQIFGMPFSMIFSIILIIFFIVAAFIAISIFWSPTKCALSDNAQEGLFKQDLQDAVNEVWNSAGGQRDFKIDLPSKIDKICFLDFSESAIGVDSSLAAELKKFGSGNLYLYPGKKACEGFRAITIEHLDIEKITDSRNPLCFDNSKSLTIKKEFNEALVSVS